MEKTTAIMSDDEFYEYRKNLLKENLTLEDCLSCEETCNILCSEHFWEFEKNCLPKIEELYGKTRNEMRGKFATPLYYDIHDDFSGQLGILVYKNIKKNYDLSIFHDCPDLANPIMDHTNKILKQMTVPNEQKNQLIKLKKMSTKKFDWSTKTYK